VTRFCAAQFKRGVFGELSKMVDRLSIHGHCTETSDHSLANVLTSAQKNAARQAGGSSSNSGQEGNQPTAT
jgi:hypothetical protein